LIACWAFRALLGFSWAAGPPSSPTGDCNYTKFAGMFNEILTFLGKISLEHKGKKWGIINHELDSYHG
jgi:hypothetical protein